MDIKVGLFIVSMNYVLLVYIIEIHWELLVEFSCDSLLTEKYNKASTTT